MMQVIIQRDKQSKTKILNKINILCYFLWMAIIHLTLLFKQCKVKELWTPLFTLQFDRVERKKVSVYKETKNVSLVHYMSKTLKMLLI